MTRLEAAVSALGDVDVPAWPGTRSRNSSASSRPCWSPWTASCPGSPTGSAPVAGESRSPPGLTRDAGRRASGAAGGRPDRVGRVDRARTGTVGWVASRTADGCGPTAPAQRKTARVRQYPGGVGGGWQDGCVRFLDLAATSAAVTATSGRSAKIELLAGALRALDPAEIAVGSGYLAGELRQRQTGVGWASLRELPPPAAEPSLTVGRGRRGVRRDRRRGRRRAPRPPAAAARRPVRRGHRRRAAALVGLFARRAAPGRPGRPAGRRDRPGRRGARRRRCAGRCCSPATCAGRRVGRAHRRRRGAGRVPAAGRPPARADARPERRRRRRRALAAPGAPAAVDVEARRHPDPGAPRRRRRRRLHPQPRRHHRPGARGGRGRRARCRPRELVLDGEAIALDAGGRPRPFQETSSRAASRGRRDAQARRAAHAVLLRPAAPRRRRPARRAGRERWAGSPACVPARAGRRRATVDHRPRGRRGVRRRARRRPRGRGGQVAATRPTTPAAAARPGSRSSPGTPSTWWCSPSSGATAGARAGCPTCTWAPATRRPAAS